MYVGKLSDGSSSVGIGEKLIKQTADDRVMDSMSTSSHIGGTGEGRETTTVPVDMQPKKQCFRSENQFEQLFPRLPNEITFCRIVPKLPWRAFHILAAVSRVWRKAIQDHRIYDARIRSCSTDALVVHAHDYSKSVCFRNDARFARISVYSVRDKLCYNLPPIPGHDRGIPSSCECVSLDGKIYVLGGAVEECVSADSPEKNCSDDSSSKVYVLDLAGASHWKECAGMERGRQAFGCSVIDGKIYVFGGSHDFGPVRGAEVYNPKVNAWSPITPMRSLRCGHQAYTCAGKILVHGGRYYNEYYTYLRVTSDEWPMFVEDWDVDASDTYVPTASFWKYITQGRTSGQWRHLSARMIMSLSVGIVSSW